MPKTMSLNVRVTGALSDYVAQTVGAGGSYENVSEYIRDLIRRDKEAKEQKAFEALKAELELAFAAPEEDYEPLSATDIYARNAAPRS